MPSGEHVHEWYFIREDKPYWLSGEINNGSTYMVFGCRWCGKIDRVKELE